MYCQRLRKRSVLEKLVVSWYMIADWSSPFSKNSKNLEH